ncbi:MAG: hypothetical protein EXR52_08640 [Dehalococcoidia bacterium]|nr:hypothetical protein [Dehalococcoidia bacterium]
MTLSTDRKWAVIKGLVCIAAAALPVAAGLWFGALVQSQRGSWGLRAEVMFLGALPFIAGLCFLVAGLLTARSRLPSLADGLLYFGAGILLCLGILGAWSVGIPL